MRNWIVAGLVAVALGLVGGAGFAHLTRPAHSHGGSAISVVKVAAAGRGSGVHIDGGLILTAAHVTGGAKSVSIITNKGDTETAEVVWEKPNINVSLLKTAGGHAIAVSPILCRPNYMGQRLSLRGSPSPFEFVRSPAVVMGEARAALSKDAVLPVSGTAAPGMSGGPALDTNGRVVGIISAMLTIAPSFLAIVPALAICNALGAK